MRAQVGVWEEDRRFGKMCRYLEFWLLSQNVFLDHTQSNVDGAVLYDIID